MVEGRAFMLMSTRGQFDWPRQNAPEGIVRPCFVVQMLTLKLSCRSLQASQPPVRAACQPYGFLPWE